MYALVPWGPGRVRFDGWTRSPTACDPYLVEKQTRHNSFTTGTNSIIQYTLTNIHRRTSLIISVTSIQLAQCTVHRYLYKKFLWITCSPNWMAPDLPANLTEMAFLLKCNVGTQRHIDCPDSDSGCPSNRKLQTYLQCFDTRLLLIALGQHATGIKL